MISLYKSLYFTRRFFAGAGIVIFMFALGPVHPVIFKGASMLLIIFLALLVADILLLYVYGRKATARRVCPERFSNGDDNPVDIYVQSFYPLKINIRIFDDIPYQFQRRDVYFKLECAPNEEKIVQYKLRPTERGEYHFGFTNVFASTFFGIAERKFSVDNRQMVKVYPSFLQLKNYELAAISNQLVDYGIKKIRKLGHNMEFEHIKEYVRGDDFRTINWKATARKNELMVNIYQDERSQNVYSVIDMGRVMLMPFEGLSLLDYAINSSLIISGIAIRKDDKAGLLTYEKEFKAFLPAGKRKNQMNLILETLYNQRTSFGESDTSRLYIKIKRVVNQRSLLLLYTNFESLQALERQLFYLTQLNRSHLLVVIFFKNTELDRLIHSKPENTEEIYHKTIAEKFAYEKKLMVSLLARHGIQAILTKPKDLNADVINKYIELKARGMF